jgi:pimeloyl-[acyl-carrier protein] methyl ester esterase
MPALVVLPGLDGTATLLSDFVEAARATFDSVVVVPYPHDRVLDYKQLESLARLSLPRDEPFFLLGESFSGPIALSIAADPPPGLIGLILSTTFAKNPVSLLRPFAYLTPLAPVRTLPMPVLSWWLLGRWATPQIKDALHSALRSVDSPVLRARAANALRSDVTECLSRITVPVLYLRASEDRLLSSTVGESLLSALPHAKLVTISGPHLLLQGAPAASAQAVAAFVAGLG